MKLTGKIIDIQQPPNKQTCRADITAKLDDVSCRAASQYLFQFPQQDAKFFGVDLVGDDGIFGEELVGDHWYIISQYINLMPVGIITPRCIV